MTPDEFVETILSAYAAARKSRYPCERVERGRSHSISAEIEDLMACYLARNDKTGRHFFVDQPVRLDGKLRYPDILIQNTTNEIENLVDLKTDPGWMRGELKNFAADWNEKVLKIRRQGSVTFKTGERNQQRHAKGCSPRLKYHIIFLTLENGSKKTREHFNALKDGMFPGVEVYCLTEGVHPNLDKDSTEQGPRPRAVAEEFARIGRNLLF